MKTKKLFLTITKVCFGLFVIMYLCACNRDAPVRTIITEYQIQSIKIDDDGEYHIVAVSTNGDVKTMTDAHTTFDFNIRYSDAVSHPILQIKESDKDIEGTYYPDGVPYVILPYGYKIEIFND